jgi:hypothetical protein
VYVPAPPHAKCVFGDGFNLRVITEHNREKKGIRNKNEKEDRRERERESGKEWLVSLKKEKNR